MRVKRFMRFFSEDVGGGFGNSEPSSEPSVQLTEAQAPPANQSAPAYVDASALAKEFGSTLSQHFQQQKESQPKQPPTPEQIKEAQRQLGFWEPDDAFLQEFGNLDTQRGAFIKMRDAMMNQFVNIARAQQETLRQDFTQQLTPLQSLIQERQVAEQKQRFSSAYPTLGDSKLQPVLEAVGNQLAKAGKFNGLNEAQAFDELAKGVESVIQVTNPTFKLASPNNNGQQSNAIAHTSSGSGGGGGNAPAAGGKPAAIGILGSVRGKK